MEQHVRGSRVVGNAAASLLLPPAVGAGKLIVAFDDRRPVQPLGNGGRIEVNEQTFAKLLDCGQPVGALR